MNFDVLDPLFCCISIVRGRVLGDFEVFVGFRTLPPELLRRS